jgi:hypothetical protein
MLCFVLFAGWLVGAGDGTQALMVSAEPHSLPPIPVSPTALLCFKHWNTSRTHRLLKFSTFLSLFTIEKTLEGYPPNCQERKTRAFYCVTPFSEESNLLSDKWLLFPLHWIPVGTAIFLSIRLCWMQELTSCATQDL